jgi:hypothetical protein
MTIPSVDTTAACCTPATRRTMSSSSQPKSVPTVDLSFVTDLLAPVLSVVRSIYESPACRPASEPCWNADNAEPMSREAPASSALGFPSAGS